MKKLFLQDGKLMVGQFPEEPEENWTGHNTPHQDDVHEEWQKYHDAVSAAKDSAVECDIGLGFAKIIAVDKMEEGQLYDLPQGWTVEIEETCKWHGNQDDCGNETCWDIQECQKSPSKKIARLMPLKEQIHYPDQSDFQTEEEFFEACRKIRELGIVAAGVPKDGWNAAIDKVLSIIMEKNHDYPIHHVYEELEKLKL